MGINLGFPGGSDGKESRPGFDPWAGKIPLEKGTAYPLQYSGLENSMDFIVHGSQRVGHD